MTELSITGYASRFDEADLSGDIVRRGAFAASLLSRAAPFPMLFGHDTDAPVGVWDRVVEDSAGLRVEGRVLIEPASALVREGAVSGLSIGYRTRRSTARAGGGRDLHELDLWEVSVVAFPMLRSARIDPIDDTPETLAQPSRSIA